MQLTQAQRERARALHEPTLVVAGHTDISADVVDQRWSGRRAVVAERHLPVFRTGGIGAIFEHVGGDGPYFDNFPFRSIAAPTRLGLTLRAIDALECDLAEAPGQVVRATTVAEIEAARRNGQVAIVYCLEGAMPIEDDLALLRTFYRLGVRCAGLTWNHRNQLADGVSVGTDAGLTALGVAAVAEMNRLGILIDVSHLNDGGTWHTLEVSRQPIVASHSNCRTVCDHPRNVTDDMIKAIAKGGGLVGVHAMSMLISPEPPPTLDQMLDHVEHVVKIAGEDYVAIGPDLMENWPLEVYERSTMGGFKFLYPEEFDTLAKFPNITAGLVARGHSDEAIKKIIGGNWLRVCRAVWGS
ncbi:MAG: membrane dipeptidase [Chloroflexi bacterium]|nr:membrane dipeptidase [Chloroflexota bacterium]